MAEIIATGQGGITEVTVMELRAPRTQLVAANRQLPLPLGHDLLLSVTACGVCRTDLHVVDGDIGATLPIVPGHEIVGRVVAAGPEVVDFAVGDRVGVPWLGRTCGVCAYCRSGQENLCDNPLFTGFSRDGGFATHCIADSRYCLTIPDRFSDVQAAPLLCAGLIGYRALKKAGSGHRIGFYGYGAAAHILTQVAREQGREIYAFTRRGDEAGQRFARSLGCAWAGDSDSPPPAQMDAAIIFAPAGELVPRALKHLRKGGRVVCGGIHMSDIPSFPYRDLWGERAILSVANLTREDGREFMKLAAQIPLETHTAHFPLEDANRALDLLRDGRIEGAAVLVPNSSS